MRYDMEAESIRATRAYALIPASPNHHVPLWGAVIRNHDLWHLLDMTIEAPGPEPAYRLGIFGEDEC